MHMYAWQAIQNVLNYIEGHLSEEPDLETLARVAGLSPYYFQRLFTRLVNKPVYEYIKLRRLAKSTLLLEDKNKRIIDVAIECGFPDHATFTRAYKNTYGITPQRFRNNPLILNHFVKPDLSLNFVCIDENETLVCDDMVLEIKRQKLTKERFFVGLASEVSIEELTRGQNTGIATTGSLWNAFHRKKTSIPGLIPGGNEFGVLYGGSARPGFCMYMAGAEAENGIRMEDYITWTLPQGEYVLCCFEAENFTDLVGSAIFKASLFMDHWMQEHHMPMGDFAAEIYYDISPSAKYMEHWRPLISLEN